MSHQSVLQRKIHNIPWALVFIITALCLYGVILMYSAAGGNLSPWGYKQLINFAIFMPIALIIGLTDITKIFKIAYLPYCILLLTLIAVDLYGHTVMGGKRWIDIIGIRIQPSELIKIAVVLTLSKYLHSLSEKDINNVSKLFIPIILILLPTILVIKQPDLGTGLIILMIGCILLFAAGVEIKKFIILGSACLASAPILWYLLYDYQKKRIMVFLNPELDPLGAGYNIIQSKIAIGSGGFSGKGLTMGTQSQLDFLPEHQTDFIFALLAEELGFCGTMLLIILCGLLIYISLSIATNARSTFSKLLTVGVTSIFSLHVFINIAMVIGLLPAVGVPLPFISHGGTITGSMLCGFGFVINTHIHRHVRI